MFQKQFNLNHKGTFIFAVFFTLLAFFISTYADDISIEIVNSKPVYKNSDTVYLGLKVNIPEKFHLYGNPLGPGIGKPLSISIQDGEGISWDHVKKIPAKKYVPSIGDWVWAYSNETYFFIQGRVNAQIDTMVQGKIIFDALICHTSCLPVKKEIPFSLSIKINANIENKKFFENRKEFQSSFTKAVEEFSLDVNSSITSLDANTSNPLSQLKLLGSTPNSPSEKEVSLPFDNWNFKPIEQKNELTFIWALLFGLLAGIILNFMPCVLPVIGIKILSFTNAQHSKHGALIHSLSFSSGIISIFLVLASLASFANFSWGQQFQNPFILSLIIVLIIVFALGMFDLYTLSISASTGPGKVDRYPLLKDFLNGVFATILATPCSGPLLGATLAWTLTQSTLTVFVIFTTIGIGMALPYILFSINKSLLRLIPKPGPWMNDLKHFMGFVLFGAAAYLLTGLSNAMIVSTLGFSVFLIYGIMLYKRISPWGAVTKKKIIGVSIFLLLAVTGFYVNFFFVKNTLVSSQDSSKTTSSITWNDFTPEILKDALSKGQPVVIDFTASWCLNCQFNKATVLKHPSVEKIINKKGILTLKADLTSPNPDAEKLLHHLGSRSVPFLAIFSGTNPNEPFIMRDILNKSRVISALEKIDKNLNKKY